MSILEINQYLSNFHSEKIWENNDDFNEIPKVNINHVSYSLFLETFLLKNKPCILTNVGSKWRSKQEWLIHSNPNFDFLKNNYGEIDVPITNCHDKYYNSQKKETRKLKHFIDYWTEYKNKGYPENMSCLYLKDWHFTRDFPSDDVYQIPHVFASDWLNEYYSQSCKQDDYRFVYMGPSGTWHL
uniref:Cupin-like domain-containing protein n=1 Tax=Clastoptera arizonana TaxID=38151 RepID=A0A1B6CWY3_9HEMI